MWTWVGGPTALNFYGSIGFLGLESTNNKLIGVENHIIFSDESPMRIYLWGGRGYATSNTSGAICMPPGGKDLLNDERSSCRW